jgi:hypothetical protein
VTEHVGDEGRIGVIETKTAENEAVRTFNADPKLRRLRARTRA